MRGILGSPFLPRCYHSPTHLGSLNCPAQWSLSCWVWPIGFGHKITKFIQFIQCIKFIQFIQFVQVIQLCFNWFWEFISDSVQEITWGYSQQKFQSCLHSVRCQMDHAMESHKSGKREIYGSRFLSPSQCMRPHLLPVHRQDLRNTLSRIWEIEFVKSVHFRESEKYTYENLRNRVWKIRWMWLEI